MNNSFFCNSIYMRLGVENRKNGDLGVQFSRKEEGVMVKEK